MDCYFNYFTYVDTCFDWSCLGDNSWGGDFFYDDIDDDINDGDDIDGDFITIDRGDWSCGDCCCFIAD